MSREELGELVREACEGEGREARLELRGLLRSGNIKRIALLL